MIDELLSGITRSLYDSHSDKKFEGVMVGTVINVLDPLMLGRVQVQLKSVDSLDLAPWARIAQPMAGAFSGTYFVPNIGDEVLIAFEHGDANAPYVIGSLWNLAALPPLQTPLLQTRAIRTLAGNQIVMREVPPSITLQTAPTPPAVLPSPPSPVGPYQTIDMGVQGISVMTPTTITLQVGPATSLVMTPASITLTAGGHVLTISPAGIQMAGPTVGVTAGFVNITGGLVKIN